MPNPGINTNPKGNPNIKDVYSKSTGPKTPNGKFLVSLNRLKDIDRVPEELKELFVWYKGMKKKDVDSILELKNIYEVVKSDSIKKITKKIQEGKDLRSTDLNQIMSMANILEKVHKLEFGDKKVIEKTVTMIDVRNQIFGDRNKKVVEGVLNEETDDRAA